MRPFYITTPIYYVNDHPHVGHIYTTLVTDTVARYRRLTGHDVRFLTGTDEHGQNIERAAAERGVEPIALGDEVVERYHELWRKLDLTHDDFIRTTEGRHRSGVEAIIARIAEAGDFYVSKHEGWYCPKCETFYTEKELAAEHRCPVHESPCESRSEENVFFRLSKYQQPLLDYYEANPDFIQPPSRANEVKQFVAGGLKDLSVSRTSVSWAIPFPEREGHTVYVWLDALTNYISALGFGRDDDSLYRQYWQGEGDTVHIIGKDILRFHAVFWPAFLLSAGLPLPTTVWAHGWWLRDDRKISKSVGAIVRPDDLIDNFGADALRFYVLRDMVFGQDAQFSDEGFIDRYNTDLANDLGNTASRLVTLSRRAFDDQLPPTTGDALRATAEEVVAEYLASMDSFAFHDAIRSLWRLLQETNQYLVQNEPWKKLKDPDQRQLVAEVLWSSLEAVRIVASALLPILPDKAPKVLAAIGADVPIELTTGLRWGGLPTSAPLPAIEPIFPRIDKKAYLAQASTPADATAKNTAKNTAEKAAKQKHKETVLEPVPEDQQIDIDQFFSVQLRAATIQAAEAVPKSNKLLKLTVEVGEAETRTVVAGIAKAYQPDELIGRQVVVVANLKPAKLMGVESNGMVLAASVAGRPILLRPDEAVPAGTSVR